MKRLVQIDNIEGIEEPMAGILRQMKHNLEVVTGQTGLDKTDRAIKYGDVKVKDSDAQLSVEAAGAAPTKAEFDKAVADITALREQFNYIVALLRGENMGA